MQDKDADIIHVSWCLPPKGWIKLNVDGAFTKNGVAGCGGILRGEKGEWLRGFSLKVGEISPIATEFRAIIEGLKVCWLHGFTNVVVESDASEVIMAINSKQVLHKCRHLHWELQELLTQEWDVKLAHVFREANKCADMMASVSLRQTQNRMDWIGPPISLMGQLDADRNGLTSPRRILD